MAVWLPGRVNFCGSGYSISRAHTQPMSCLKGGVVPSLALFSQCLAQLLVQGMIISKRWMDE